MPQCVQQCVVLSGNVPLWAPRNHILGSYLFSLKNTEQIIIGFEKEKKLNVSYPNLINTLVFLCHWKQQTKCSVWKPNNLKNLYRKCIQGAKIFAALWFHLTDLLINTWATKANKFPEILFLFIIFFLPGIYIFKGFSSSLWPKRRNQEF